MTFYFPSLSVCWKTTRLLVAFISEKPEAAFSLGFGIVHEVQHLLVVHIEQFSVTLRGQTIDCLQSRFFKTPAL